MERAQFKNASEDIFTLNVYFCFLCL